MASGKSKAKAAGKFTGTSSYTVSPGGSAPRVVPKAPTVTPYTGVGRTPTSRVPETRAAGAAQQNWADSKPITSLGDPTVGNGSAMDELALGIPPIDTSSTYGGSSYGGGGGGGGVSSAVSNAYRQALAEIQASGVGAAYDQYEGRLNKAFDPSGINQIYDTAQTGVQTASKAGLDRLGPILQGLRDRAAQARTGVSDAFAQSDARLSALGSQYGARQQGTTNNLNDMLGAFDAGQVTGPQTNIDGLFANARLANEGFRRTNDVGLADRPAVYEGLNADVRSGITRDESGLLNQVAMGRAGGLRQNESALQQALAQAGLGRLQAEQADQQRIQDMRLRMAELGITI